MHEAGYTIKLPVFEGPFDLLFHLIKKAEVDIWSVSLAEITEQYLAYLQSMKELNLDIASEFLVMAATLLRLKSKLLLPRPPKPEPDEEEEELFNINSAEELFNRLEEYRLFKETALLLKEKEAEQQKIYLRSTGGQKMMVISRQQSYYFFWEGPHLLSEIMRSLAEAAAAAAMQPTIDTIDDFPVADKLASIYDLLRRSGKALPLSAFIRSNQLWELITTFIALLELARRRKVLLFQERPFGRILVAVNQDKLKEQEDGA
ncbi:MAG: segregation/condensation protein A [Firmicutes bacterium]|jgi:segregation and condensation protein A|nr:segregation/condensation protein A [Bacillota bacterium]